jgi:subtilisin family serine protease
MYVLLSLFIVLTVARSPLIGENNPKAIPGRYIAIYHPFISDALIYKHQMTLGDSIIHKYNISEKYVGFAARLTSEQLEAVRDTPYIKEVHVDVEVNIFQSQCDSEQENPPSWGIARVSHYGAIPEDGLDSFYYNAGKAGAGVYIYVIDTGIRTTHVEFGGRAVWGTNTIDNLRTDDNGHGTHCAGTAAGNSCGIGRNARVVAVRALNGTGSGTTASIIAGINYVADQRKSNMMPTVALLSLGSSLSPTINDAVDALVSGGTVAVTAAGNSNSDACQFSPGSAKSAINVGATSLGPDGDIRTPSSNWGTCVALFAPGGDIYSAYITSDNSYATYTGSSSSAAHVAGLAAQILQALPNSTPIQVKNNMIDTANQGFIVDAGTGSPNLIAYNGC